MKTAVLLPVLLSVGAAAAPNPAALVRSALPPGFAPTAGFDEPVFVPAPAPVLMRSPADDDTESVALAPLLDRHLSTTDSFAGAGGTTQIAGTLDLGGAGYLAVSPPRGDGERPTYLFRIERGMSGQWHDGARSYRVNLSVSIFRARLANYIQIRDASTGEIVWERRIGELFRITYAAGEPVTLAGRPYRLFYSRLPDRAARAAMPSSALGLCFIYDDTSGGGHDYKFYMVPVERIRGVAPVTYRLFGGDAVALRASEDLSLLELGAPASMAGALVERAAENR